MDSGVDLVLGFVLFCFNFVLMKYSFYSGDPLKVIANIDEMKHIYFCLLGDNLKGQCFPYLRMT